MRYSHYFCRDYGGGKMNNYVAFSGGIDSTALALAMPDAIPVFTDTGWEFDELYAHIEKKGDMMSDERLDLRAEAIIGFLGLHIGVLTRNSERTKEQYPRTSEVLRALAEATKAARDVCINEMFGEKVEVK